MLFTVETVSCLGACGLAPTLTVNDEVHPKMTEEKAIELLNRCEEKAYENEEMEKELLNKQKEVNEKIRSYTCRVLVCSGTGCCPTGSREKIYEEVKVLCRDVDR